MADRYSALSSELGGIPACILRDDDAALEATWMLGAGMLGGSLVHRGEQLLWQGGGPASYASQGAFMGIPFLHPWANRLAGFSYSAGGQDVTLDRDSPLLKLDDNGLPIHGVLTASRDWTQQRLEADESGARLLAALEFDRPELLAAFPFPHRVEMRVSLDDAGLEVRTEITATGERSVPVAYGFHPYLQLSGTPRREWEVAFPVHRRLLLDERMIPTGETEPAEPITGEIADRTWDDGFDRIGSPARFEIRGSGRTITVEYLDGFPIAQIFAPPGEDYVCVEPMTARANALRGPAEELEWVKPGESRSSAFRISCD